MGGKVFLVGAGPGDPGLLTVRGRELLQAADAVLYDALVAPEMLEGLAESCERVFVGKRAGEQSMTQSAINAEIVRRVQTGQRVVRLKGGDPFVFGRGGEEAAACREAGIAFEVVPGVTSAFAVPASAGIPVVHRGVSSSVLVIHGHFAPLSSGDDADAGKNESEKHPGVVVRRRKKSEDEIDSDDDIHEVIDLSRVANAAETLVFLMGVRSLDALCQGLIDAGRSARTPAALVQWGTTPRQKTVTGTLETLPGRVHASSAGTPGVIVVGEVVNLREILETFEQRPLFGRRVALVEPLEHSREMRHALTDAGARVHVVPCHAGPPLAASDAEKRRLHLDLLDATHLVVMRPGLARVFIEGLKAFGLDATVWCRNLHVIAVGEDTRDALAYHGIGSQVAPEQVADLAFESAWETPWKGSRAIVVEPASEWIEVSEELESRGVHVSSLVVEDYVALAEGHRQLEKLVASRRVDSVVFMSVAAVRSTHAFYGSERFVEQMSLVTVMALNPAVHECLASLGVAAPEVPEQLPLSEFVTRLATERPVLEHETTEVDA